jgi:hypothetical protein
LRLHRKYRWNLSWSCDQTDNSSFMSLLLNNFFAFSQSDCLFYSFVEKERLKIWIDKDKSQLKCLLTKNKFEFSLFFCKSVCFLVFCGLHSTNSLWTLKNGWRGRTFILRFKRFQLEKLIQFGFVLFYHNYTTKQKDDL